MARPLPPVVQGPVTPFSPSVRAIGALKDADVYILEDGAPIGSLVAPVNGNVDVPLSRRPVVGRAITAGQKTAGGVSDPSPFAIPVVDIPNPLPTPSIASVLHTCVSDVLVEKLAPGATVHAQIGGQPFAATIATDTRQWLSMDPVAPIPSGATMTVWQEITLGGGQVINSPTVSSLPIPPFGRDAHGLAAPKLNTPLKSCATSISFLAVTGGAVTTIDNEGMSETFPNPADAFTGVGGQLLRKGKLVAQQFLRRCGIEGAKAEYQVDPAEPGKPAIVAHACPDTRRIRLTNLTPGSILHFRRDLQTSPTGWSMDHYSDIGVGATEQDIDLPEDIPLIDPTYSVVLDFWQELCGVVGPSLKEPVIALPAAHAPPKIAEPVYDCARGLRVRGASPGALLQAIDSGSNLPLCAVTPAPAADFVLMCWFSMIAWHKVVVRQTGCNAAGDSNVAVVQPVPAQLPTPDVKTPRPGATRVVLSKVLPGAAVQLVVKGVPRSPSIVLWDDPSDMPVFGPALQDGDDVLPVQMLCAASSRHEGRGVVVTRGRMKVSASPPSVTTGTTASVTVPAVDAMTGDPVLASVLINGKLAGMTGTPFAFSPKAGDPPPAGVVSEPVGYIDETFTITLVAPVAPSPPSWSITLHTSPKRAFLGTAPIDVSQAHFDIVADWDSTLKRGVSASPIVNSPEMVGTTSLPAPTGGVNTVTVTAWVDWSSPGGSYNGILVSGAGGPSNKVVFKINHNAPAHNAYLVWATRFVYDPGTDSGSYWIELALGSISP